MVDEKRGAALRHLKQILWRLMRGDMGMRLEVARLAWMLADVGDEG